MKEIFLLTKTLLKSSSSETRKKGEKTSKGFNKILFFVFVYGYIIAFMSFISYYAIESLIAINQPAVFLNIAFVAMLGFCIIQSVISSLNILFFSKDLDFLLPLPITPNKIIISKLNCLIISQYMMSALIVLPGVIIYGYLLNLEYYYYIIAILNLLVFPIIPVVIVFGLLTLVMRFTRIIKNRDFVQYLTILVTLFLIIAVQSLSGTSGTSSQEDIAQSLLETNGLIEKFSGGLINIKLIMNSIINYNSLEGVLNLLLLMFSSSVIYYVVSYLISKIYVKTIISLSTVKTKKAKNIDLANDLNSSLIPLSYIKKEFKLLIRTPIFFMQCVLPPIIFPIIIGVPAIIGVQDSGVDMGMFLKDFGIVINTNFGLICSLVTIVFMYIFNYTSVTAVSRDGENAVFMKYIPLDLKKQIFYKMFPGVLLNLIPAIYIMLLGIIFIENIKLKTIIYIFIITTFINILNNLINILIDLKHPKLKWITEYAVVKQNINMIFVFILVAIEIGTIIWLGSVFKTIDVFAMSLIVICMITYIFISRFITKNRNTIFEKIQ